MLMAGFSDSVSFLVLPFWETAMFKIHLKKGKLSSRFKYSALKMENGAVEIGSCLAAGRSRKEVGS